MPGPAPKPPTKRRNRGIPKSYGAATPTIAPAASAQDRKLGFAAHPMIQALWDSTQSSCEARFYSAADWERLRLELSYGNRLLRGRSQPPAASWAAFQHGLTALLVSPAEKRRCAIELKPPDDEHEAAAVLQIAKYQESLTTEP
jgi:hypothetical protein